MTRCRLLSLPESYKYLQADPLCFFLGCFFGFTAWILVYELSDALAIRARTGGPARIPWACFRSMDLRI